MPCSASRSFTTSRISAWGAGEAPTFRVVPDRSVAAVSVGAALSAGVVVSGAGVLLLPPEQPASRPTVRAPDRSREANFFMVHSPFRSFFPSSEHKKTPLNHIQGRKPTLRGTTLLHPRLTTGALWSTNILLRAYGRTRHDLCVPAVSRTAPRPSSTGPSVPVPTIPGSLRRIFPPTLLFFAFEGRYSVPLGLHLVYNRKDLLSSGYYAPKREPDKPSDLSGL